MPNNVIELIIRANDQATAPIENLAAKIRKVTAITFAGFGIVSGLKAIVRVSAEAQTSAAQLDAAFRATGAGLGLTRERLDDLAKSLKETTALSGGAVKEAEALLLTFEKVRGEAFERTIRAAADLSARLGTDLSSSTRILGLALQEPVEAFGRLRRAGVSFSEEQKKLVEGFVRTGQTAKAQELILSEIERRYNGAAAAARNTLGGALKALKDSFVDLFQLDAGQTSGVVNAINTITKNMANLARVAVQSAAVFAVFKSTVFIGEAATTAKDFLKLFAAVASGRAVLVSTTAAQAANTVATHAANVANLQAAEAELARTTAILAGNRATQARVLANTEAVVSERARIVMSRNIVGAERAVAAATAAQVAALRAVQAGAVGAAAAAGTMTAATSRLGGALALLLAPLKGVFLFIRAHPIGLLVTAIAGAVIALTGFRDKITGLVAELNDPRTRDSFGTFFKGFILSANAALEAIDSIKLSVRELLGMLSPAEIANRAVTILQLTKGLTKEQATEQLLKEIDQRVEVARAIQRTATRVAENGAITVIDEDLFKATKARILELRALRQALEGERVVRTGRSDGSSSGVFVPELQELELFLKRIETPAHLALLNELEEHTRTSVAAASREWDKFVVAVQQGPALDPADASARLVEGFERAFGNLRIRTNKEFAEFRRQFDDALQQVGAAEAHRVVEIYNEVLSKNIKPVEVTVKRIDTKALRELSAEAKRVAEQIQDAFANVTRSILRFDSPRDIFRNLLEAIREIPVQIAAEKIGAKIRKALEPGIERIFDPGKARRATENEALIEGRSGPHTPASAAREAARIVAEIQRKAAPQTEVVREVATNTERVTASIGRQIEATQGAASSLCECICSCLGAVRDAVTGSGGPVVEAIGDATATRKSDSAKNTRDVVTGVDATVKNATASINATAILVGNHISAAIASSAGSSGMSALFTDFFGSLITGGFGAGGGRQSGLTTVGEEGRELVILPPGSRVRNQRQAAFAGGGPSVILQESNSITITGGDAEENEKRLAQFFAIRDAKLERRIYERLQSNGFRRMT